jgi:hypothetical protein
MIHNFKTFESSYISSINKNMLDQLFGSRWILNPETGLIDIRGDFSLPREVSFTDEFTNKFDANLFQTKIGTVTGSVRLARRGLTSLPFFMPKRVEGDCIFSENKLQNLEGCPEYVGGNIEAEHNYLESLKGAPKYVGGWFLVSYNPHLKDLVGGPEYVNYGLEALGCKDLTLKGAPEYIGQTLSMDLNKKRFDLKNWNLDGWLELLDESRPRETYKILPLFTKERMKKIIDENPEKFVLTLAKYKEKFDLSNILPHIQDLIPEKYRNEFNTLGDLGSLGF